MNHVGAPVRMLSICSGIGMLDLALGRVFRVRSLGFVERDVYAASVLLARMESEDLEPAPVWIGNLQDLDACALGELVGNVEAISAGIPCPDWSSAGKRLGRDGAQDLTDELLRIVRLVGPRALFLENVSGYARSEGLGYLLGALASLGFDAEWATLRAADVGAPHLRRRLFLSAHRGVPDALSNALREFGERGGQQRGQPREAEPGNNGASAAAANSLRIGLEDNLRTGAAPRPAGQPRALARSRNGRLSWDRCGPPGWQDPDGTKPEPGVCGMVDGNAAREERVRCCGNAVVPDQAERAFRLLWERVMEGAS